MPDTFENKIMSSLEKTSTEPIIYRYHSMYRPSLYFSLNEDEFERYFNPHEEYHSLDYVPFMGFELEFNTVHHDIGRRSNLIDLIQKSNNIFGNNTFIYYMRDGSIGYGLEMISQPATYEFYLAHKDLLKRNFENIINHGFTAGYSCGLHIHFNKDYYGDKCEECTEKILTIIDMFWKQLVFFSRRRYSRIERWSNKYDKTPEEIVSDMKYGMFPDRYHVLNIRNRTTLEFRIYASTLDLDEFLATLELTNNIIRASKELSVEQIKNLTFDYFLTSPNLQKYYKKYSSASRIKKYKKYLEVT